MLVITRRPLLAATWAAAVAIRTTRPASAMGGLAKLPWGGIFGAAQVVLGTIELLKDYLLSDSAEAKAALCKLPDDAISSLRCRCLALGLALDSTGDGPVVPPDKGTIGIVPALEAFVARQDPETTRLMRDACFRIVDASENLVREVDAQALLPLLRRAGMRTEDVYTLREHIRYSGSAYNEFMHIYEDKMEVGRYDVERARALLTETSEMPKAARSAVAALGRIARKRHEANCRP